MIEHLLGMGISEDADKEYQMEECCYPVSSMGSVPVLADSAGKFLIFFFELLTICILYWSPPFNAIFTCKAIGN